MKLVRNLLAGFMSSAWSALVALAAIPFYIHYLGVEAYGLIGFHLTTQALMHILDMGMGTTINREAAKGFTSGDLSTLVRLYCTFSRVFWFVALVIFLLFIVLSPWIAESWLQSNKLSDQSVSNAVMLMGVSIACRWPLGLYQGVLIGGQRLIVLSTVNVIMVTVGSLGAILILALWSPTIEAFFVWQAFVNLTHTLLIRRKSRKLLNIETSSGAVDWKSLRLVWRFATGSSGIALTGLVLLQADKILLSKLLNLEDFGSYMLATTVAGGLYILLSPLFNALYPRMTTLVAAKDTERVIFLYKSGTRLLVTVLFPLVFAAAMLSEELLYLWTRNQALAESASTVTSLLMIGTALNGFMIFPYALLLAHGETKLSIGTNLILIALTVPMTILLAISYGAVGGALSWVMLNIVYVFLGTWRMHRKFYRGEGVNWLVFDVGVPILLAGLIFGFGRLILVDSLLVNVPICIGLILASILCNMTLSPNLRSTTLTILSEMYPNSLLVRKR